MHGVYIKTDEQGRVLEINSDAFLQNFNGWQKIDEGDGDAFRHPQNNYFPGPALSDDGVPLYVYSGGAITPRTAEEIAADVAALPPAPASVDERLDELYAALDMILTGVTE